MCPMCNIFNRKNRSYRKAENKINTQVNSSISVKKLKVCKSTTVEENRLRIEKAWKHLEGYCDDLFMIYVVSLNAFKVTTLCISNY
jgi:hypothetical protein